MKKPLLPLLLGFALVPITMMRAADDWLPLFDGQTLHGWKASEHPDSFKVVDGLIVGHGLRSHLFYMGADNKAEFENFELELDFKAMDGANSGVYFHATWQEEGWPRLSGTEVQVNNDQPAFEKNYIENKKTGSLYGFRNLYKAMAKDGEWFTYNIRVTKPRVQVRINGRLMIDYVEPSNVPVLVAGATRDMLTKGTFALQCHDEKSRILYRNIRVRRLPPGEDTAVAKPLYTEQDRQRQVLARDNFPLLNLRLHLADTFTLGQIQALRNTTGIFGGIAYQVGDGSPVRDDASALALVAAMKDEPVFVGLEIAGDARINDGLKRLAPGTLAKFDFITGCQAASLEDLGRGTPDQAAMDGVVDNIVRCMATAPIDVFADVLILPKGFTASAETLWTEARMLRVIAAAAKHGVAFEINPNQATPSETFIRLAKAAGVKFTIGSDDTTAANCTDWSYLLAIQQKVGLGWRDMWVPGHEPTRARRELGKK